jgi:hypothetical protein
VLARSQHIQCKLVCCSRSDGTLLVDGGSQTWEVRVLDPLKMGILNQLLKRAATSPWSRVRETRCKPASHVQHSASCLSYPPAAPGR